MEKQIETVYVGTMEDTTLHLAKRKGEWNALNSSMNLCHSLKEVRAYLYTQAEHAAVKGYRKALERIEQLTRMGTDISGYAQMSINEIISEALSKAEGKGEEFETSYGEVLSTIRTPIEEPTNSLDELEYYQAEREAFGLAVMNLDTETQAICDSFILAFDRLLNHLNHNPCTHQ